MGEIGAPRGDLHIIIHVKEHEFFERREANLYCNLHVSFTQAALGAEVVVPTLDGEETLRDPRRDADRNDVSPQRPGHACA